MPKATGKKKATTQALTKWDAKLAEMAAKAVATEKNIGGGNVIGTQGGRLNYKGADLPENKMNVVIIDHILANLFYEGTFDPQTPTSPVCYAYGRDEAVMAPHEQSPTPQHDSCVGCPQNEWGSADRGNGKACKNTRRIAVISENDLNGDIAQAEVAYVHAPVTSVKAWAGYVRQIQQTLNMPPLAVITEISLVPDAATQFKMLFKTVDEVPKNLIGDLLELSERVEKDIEFPYVQIQLPEKPQRGRGARKTVAQPSRRTVVPAKGRGRTAVPPPTGKAAGKFGTAAPAASRKFARR